MIRFPVSVLGAFAFLQAITLAQIPNGTVFTYQGQLKQDGAPVNGGRAITFRLFDAGSGGTQVDSDLDVASVPVVDGLFIVELDFGADPFAANQARWLEVEVEGTVLAPRQPLTSAPFSLATRGVNVDPAGNVGIGIANPTARLEVNGSIATSASNTFFFARTNPGSNFAATSLGFSSLSGGIVTLSNNGNNEIRAGQDSGPNGFLRLITNNTAPPTSPANGSEVMRLTADGKVGIGATTPSAQLHIRRTQPDNENLLELSFEGGDVGSTSEEAALLRVTSNSGFRPFFSLKNGIFLVDVTGDLISKRNAYIGNGGGGFVSIGQSGGDYGNIGYGFGFTNVSGQHTYRFNDSASRIDFRDGGFRFITAPSGTQGAIVPWTERMTVTQGGNVGIGTVSPQAKLDVAGVSRCDVLEIDGGADISEPFHIEAPGGELQPGSVVSIDPENPERLTLSSASYDRKVAGVISGAGGVRPGLTLRQEGTAADGTHPVALTGRVYVHCDADVGGAIAPGDLLTTSPTPGHAMKVTDHDRANGAVLGKAMTRLTAGRGLVLVLVGLQ